MQAKYSGDRGGQGRLSQVSAPKLWSWAVVGSSITEGSQGPGPQRARAPTCEGWSWPCTESRSSKGLSAGSSQVNESSELRSSAFLGQGREERRIHPQLGSKRWSLLLGPIRSVLHCWHDPALESHGHCLQAGNGSHRELGKGANDWLGRCPGRCRHQVCK